MEIIFALFGMEIIVKLRDEEDRDYKIYNIELSEKIHRYEGRFNNIQVSISLDGRLLRWEMSLGI